MRFPESYRKPASRRQRPLHLLMRDDRGVAVIIVAVFLVALFGLAALVVDLGMLIAARSELQNGADSGALAGLVDHVLYGPSEGEQTAKTYTTNPKNYHLVSPPPAADAVDVSIPAFETMQVRVRRSNGTSAGPIPTVFARIWGKENADVEAVAVAKMSRKVIGSGPGNLLPYGIHKRIIDADEDGLYDVGNSIDVYPHAYTPGNFGVLDLDGGSNSNSDTVQWTEQGFDQSFVIPQSEGFINITGDTGISGDSLSDPIRSRIGQRVLLPVFDQVSGEGSGSTFRVIDMVGIIITDIKLTGDIHERHFKVTVTKFSSNNLILGDESAPTNNSVSAPILIR